MLSKVYSNVTAYTSNAVTTARRYWYSFLAMMTTVSMTLTPTLCAENQMQTIMMQMLDIIYTIARFIGIAILVYGVVSSRREVRVDAVNGAEGDLACRYGQP